MKGSSTESALLSGAASFVRVRDLRSRFPVASKIPFDAARKYMVTLHKCNPTVLTGLFPALVDENGVPLAAADFCNDTNGPKTSSDMGSNSKPVSLVVVKGGSEIVIEMSRYTIYNVCQTNFTYKNVVLYSDVSPFVLYSTALYDITFCDLTIILQLKCS